MSLPLRYCYSLILPDDKGDIFAASLLILYFSFSSLIFSSISMISFDILSKRFILKRKWLSDARVLSTTKNEYGFVGKWYFLQLINKLVTIKLRSLLLRISAFISSNAIIFSFVYMDCILQYFHKYYSYHSSIQRIFTIP